MIRHVGGILDDENLYCCRFTETYSVLYLENGSSSSSNTLVTLLVHTVLLL